MTEQPLNPIAPEQRPTVDVRNSEATYSDDYSVSLVNQTYYTYSAWRKQNIEPRWVEADALYFGVVKPRTWQGTAIPRASYPQPIVFDQVETMMPLLEQALFPDSEDWFEIVPQFALPNPQTGEDLAPRLGRLLTNNLREMIDTPAELGYPSARREILNAAKQALLYKLGGIHIRWDADVKRPCLECVDIRDVYFDPKSHGPSPEMGSSVVWRKLMKVRELKELRDTKGFDIPKDDVLYWLAQSAGFDMPDVAKNIMYAMMRQGTQAGPSVYEPNIEDREIEVLIYYNRDRIVWVLNKLHPAYNQPNPYGWFPFSFAPCYEVPMASYGLSVPEVQEGSQRLIEGLFNLHLDELALNINPPRIETMQSQQDNADKWGPGVRFKVKDAKTDIQFQQAGGMTANVMDTISFALQNSYSRSGMNPLQVGGVPTPSNANRTASGMQMQTSGGNNRIYSMVKRFEDYLLIPTLTKMVEMLRMHLVDGDKIEGVNELGQYAQLNPAVWQVPLKINVKCASRVISKEKLLQLIPNFIQFFAQGPLLSAIQQIGHTLNVQEIEAAMQEATGLGKRYSFFRPLTPQELEQMKQVATPKPDPNVQVKAESAYRTRVDAEQIRAQTALQKEQMKQQPNPFEMQLEQQKAQMEMQMKQMDMQLKAFDLEIKKQSAQLDFMVNQAKARQKQEESAMKLDAMRQKTAADIEATQASHQINIANQMENMEMQRAQRAAMAQDANKSGEQED